MCRSSKPPTSSKNCAPKTSHSRNFISVKLDFPTRSNQLNDSLPDENDTLSCLRVVDYKSRVESCLRSITSANDESNGGASVGWTRSVKVRRRAGSSTERQRDANQSLCRRCEFVRWVSLVGQVCKNVRNTAALDSGI